MALLTKMGRVPFQMDGTTKDTGQSGKEYHAGRLVNEDDKPVDALVCHPKSVGHGVTFVRSRFSIEFSTSFSWEEQKQKSDRILRKGQEGECMYYHLVGRDTIDESMTSVWKKKGTKSDAMLKALKQEAGRRGE